ncbi:MAG: PfkB family carbohydrate kinase [Bernardetiaceae bacterium]
MSLLVVGSVAFDAIETPFGKTDKIIGGAATYIALTATHFVKPVYLVSVVGGDFPSAELEGFQARGVRTEGLQIKADQKSFFWSGRYHNDMNSRDTLATELNVLEHFDPIVPAAYHDAQYVLLGNLAPQVQLQVLERLPKRPALVVMDTMNFWMEVALDALKAVIARVDVLCINDEEARQLSGEYSLVKAAKKILGMGCQHLIIKKGEHGAMLFSEGKIFYAPALPLEEVFDPTGAGDTFVAGFVSHLAQTGDHSFAGMAEGIIKGSAMASFCVERFGPERLYKLTPEEIAARQAQFYQLVQTGGIILDRA